MQAHPRFREKSMSLEIRRIEVSDKVVLIFIFFFYYIIKFFKGNWMCRVWNNEGSITRNFTLHIVGKKYFFIA